MSGVIGFVLIGFVLACFAIPALAFAVAVSTRRARHAGLLWTLAITMEKRLPLAEELDAHADVARGRQRMYLRELADSVRFGLPLEKGLEDRDLVPRSVLVEAHVAAGAEQLPAALREAAVRHTQAMQQAAGNHTVGGTVVYLATVVTVALLVFAFIMYYIVPKMKKIFEDFGVELPGTTRVLIGTSDYVLEYALIVFPLLSIVVLVAIGVAVGQFLGWENLRHPWLTRWFPRADTPSVLRCLSLPIASGRPLTEALERIAVFHHREIVRNRVVQIARALERGENLWEQLRVHKFIRRNEAAVLQAAERVGNLPWALRELAERIDKRLTFRLLAWCEFVQPIVVLLMGLAVGLICIAFFLPLVKLINDLS